MQRLREMNSQDHPSERQDAWLARKTHANQPVWQCKKCSTHYDEWQAICNNCHVFSDICWSDYRYVNHVLSIAKEDSPKQLKG